jgi:hypothetical protein
VEGSCEHGNEPSSSIKWWEFLEWLHNWQLLKKSSAPWVSDVCNLGTREQAYWFHTSIGIIRVNYLVPNQRWWRQRFMSWQWLWRVQFSGLQGHVIQKQPALTGYLLGLLIDPERWRRYVPPKRRTLFELHGSTTQKPVLSLYFCDVKYQYGGSADISFKNLRESHLRPLPLVDHTISCQIHRILGIARDPRDSQTDTDVLKKNKKIKRKWTAQGDTGDTESFGAAAAKLPASKFELPRCNTEDKVISRAVRANVS